MKGHVLVMVLAVLLAAGPAVLPVWAQPAAVTLAEAVALALERSPDVRAAAAEVRAAQARVQQERAAIAPTFSASASASVAGGSGTTTTTGQVSAGVSYLVYDGGLRQALIRQAESRAAASQENLAATRLQVALAAVQTYMAVVVDEQLVGVRQQAVEQARAQLQAAQASVRAGVAPQADVIRADSRLAAAEFDLVDAQGNVERDRAALRSAIGLDPGAPLAVTPPPPPPSLDVSEEQALAAALRRPEVLAAEADTRAAEAALAAAMIRGGVTVTVDGRYVLVTTGTSTWSIGPSISIPLGDRGRAAQVEEARASLDAARARLESRRLQVRQEAVQARLTVIAAQARLAAAERAAAAAREATRVAEGRYRAGVGTVLEVLTARTEQTVAEVAILQAAAQRWTATATLRRAMALPVLP